MINRITRKLTPVRKALLALAGLVAVAAPVFIGALSAQSKPDEAKFEVASIRPGNPEINRVGMQFTPGGMQASNVTLKFLIMMAYDVQPQQVSGGPGWMDSDRFNVNAKGPEGEAGLSPEAHRQLTRQRLQALLAERFALVVRKESKEMTGYALVVAKGGPKMTESPSPESRGIRQNRGELNGQGISMDLLARQVGIQLGRRVVDKTGLTGRYDFTLKWSPQPGEGGLLGRPGAAVPGEAAESSGPSLFTALQEQLGLRLESQKVAGDLIVVERADKPSEN
jgi:uncharacterized protein (TIGR03435 family)